MVPSTNCSNEGSLLQSTAIRPGSDRQYSDCRKSYSISLVFGPNFYHQILHHWNPLTLSKAYLPKAYDCYYYKISINYVSSTYAILSIGMIAFCFPAHPHRFSCMASSEAGTGHRCGRRGRTQWFCFVCSYSPGSGSSGGPSCGVSSSSCRIPSHHSSPSAPWGQRHSLALRVRFHAFFLRSRLHLQLSYAQSRPVCPFWSFNTTHGRLSAWAPPSSSCYSTSSA